MNKGMLLVVDDEESNVALLKCVLEPKGYHVESANNGKTAIEMYIANDYDLVLLDVMMPGMDGIEACKRMIEYKKNIPIFFLTAINDNQILKRGFDAGAWDYITKPWREIELISRIEKAKKISEAEKEIRLLYEKIKHENEVHSEEIRLAVEVQNYLLPEWMILDQTMQISSTYNPSVGLGGDIYDFLPIGKEKCIAYIGDVAGHGVQAALMMSAVKALIRMIIEDEKGSIKLSKVVTRLNKSLAKDIFNNKFMTLLIMLFDFTENKMTFFNAGHPPFLIMNKQSKEIRVASRDGVYPIGWDAKLPFSETYETDLHLTKEELFLFYTDGVIESPNDKGRFLTTEGLVQLIKNNIQIADIRTIPYQIKAEMRKQGYNLAYDDFTIFTVCPLCLDSTMKTKSTKLALGNYDFENTRQKLDEICDGICDSNDYQVFLIFIKSLIENVKSKTKDLYMDNSLFVYTKEESNYINIKCYFKFVNNEHNEAMIQNILTDLINDPLYFICKTLHFTIYDDLVSINYDIKSK